MLRITTILLMMISVSSQLLAAEYNIEMQPRRSNLSIESYNENQGMLQNSVTDILQDNHGYIWISSPNGLYRYDGYNFRVFYNNPSDNTSIESSFIVGIAHGFSDDLYFTSKNIVNRYDYITEKFHRFTLPSTPHNYRLIDMVIDREDNNLIWTVSSNSLIVARMVDGKAELIARRNSTDGAVGGRILAMVEDGDKGVWILTNKGVSCNYIDESGALCECYTYPIPNAKHIVRDGDGSIILYKNSILHTFDHDDNYQNFSVDRYVIEGDKYNFVADDMITAPNGEVVLVDWGSGIARCNIDNRTVDFQSVDGFDEVAKYRYNTGTIDRSGVMWLGTMHGGLFSLNLNEKPIYAFDHFVNDENTNQISGDNRGNLYAATHYNGIVHINLADERRSNLSLSKELNLPKGEAIIGIDAIDDKLFYSIDGDIYQATLTESGHALQTKRVFSARKGMGIFYHTKGGRLYYALFSASVKCNIYYCDNSTDSNPIFTELESPLIEGVESIGSLYEDSRGWLWIGSNEMGLFRMMVKDDRVTKFEKVALPKEITKCNIFAIEEDNSGNLYIGSFGGGLVVIDLDRVYESQSYRYYTQDDGLSNNAVLSIVNAGSSDIWISTDNGISRFNLGSGSFKTYNTHDGVQSLNGRKWAKWMGNDGTLYFGGVKGISHFNPMQITSNRYRPNIQITEVKIDGEAVIYQPYTRKTTTAETSRSSTKLRIEPYESTIAITFAAMHYDNPAKNRYKYMMEGVDSGWREVGANSRTALYSKLDAGSYRFRVMATNNDGLWSPNCATIDFEVIPYWWQSWQAQIVYLIIALLIVYLLYLYTIQRHKHRLELDSNRAKLDFFTNISHEIKTPLTIISGVLDINPNDQISRHDLSIIRRNNSRMLALVTQLLDFRRATEGHAPFNPMRGDVIPLLKDISESFQLLAQKSNISYNLLLSNESLTLDFEADKIEKIVANLLSNAFKHIPAESAEIILSLRYALPNNLPNSIQSDIKRRRKGGKIDFVTITVEDNGAGIAESDLEKIFDRFYQTGDQSQSGRRAGVGVGLAYSRLLAQLHEGYIYAESSIGKGSRFYLVLPTHLTKVKVAESSSTTQSVAQFDHLISDSGVAVDSDSSALNKNRAEILIVEDNSEIRDLLKTAFSGDFGIIEAENGRVGLDIATESIPDLIISDVMMPEMDGVEMCSKLRSSDVTNHIPIILLTAKNAIEHRIDGLRSGADSYISKPFNLEHLRVRIEKLLEMRELLKHKYQQDSKFSSGDQLDLQSGDREFIQLIEQTIEQHLAEPEFTVEALEGALCYSQMQLYRRVKSITGGTVVEFIRNYRLRRAVDYMRQGQNRINEILFLVGFTTPSYFSKCFRKRYGKSPMEFIDELKNSVK